ncbi:hypothetical protein K1T71_012660 [Dendrolimus kikuchii]|uniref:Uncharacterized protein n=1 Tax=Dendrolimus kikuchii TaxID=765133 RepID=A0ACC1CK98_9NEOP|nr:hypothetical protein K1T71_012660 [Dendrolimus kikuchii]
MFKMPLEWGSLPLLPLRCILDHLSTEDALAATSTCRHWRNSLLLYEGWKDILVLRVGQLEKNLFLTRIFRKHTKKLLVYIDCVTELDKFLLIILPQFFDTATLKELLFVGPRYVHHNQYSPIVKVNRVIVESLVFKHSHCIRTLAFMGCEMGTMKSENERYTHKHVEYYSRPLSFSIRPSPTDTVLSRCNADLMVFSTLKHILVDYEQINTDTLETLSQLNNFTNLSLNITRKKQFVLKPIDWQRLRERYPKGLDVAVNIISLPHRKFVDVIENVLVEGLTLTSLKVMFCKNMYTPLLSHIVRLYQSTLRELVWADSPYEATDSYHRFLKHMSHTEPDTYNVNPFILLCWQCVHLQRLVIHGYWVWQYDLLGFVRLRKGLCQLEVSAIYRHQDAFKGDEPCEAEDVVRVLVGDHHAHAHHDFIDEVNLYTDFEWKPSPWSKLHPALRARSTPQQRADYIIQEVRRPLGITKRVNDRSSGYEYFNENIRDDVVFKLPTTKK